MIRLDSWNQSTLFQIDDLQSMASGLWSNDSLHGFQSSDYMSSTNVFLHPSPGEHECDICGKVYRAKSTLARHKKDHTGTFVKCASCTLHFTSVKNLVDHKIKKHCCKYVCLKCGKTFSGQSLLDIHMWKEHQEGPHSTLPRDHVIDNKIDWPKPCNINITHINQSNI